MPTTLYVPPKLALPVSKGGDLIVDFQQFVNDIYTDYDPGVTVRLEIDVQQPSPFPGAAPSAPTILVAPAEITGYHAVCKFEVEDADTITNGSFWRCVVSYPTFPQTTEVIGVNGRIKRQDG